MFRYVHTNIVAKDAARLIDFYKSVLGCTSVGETRDLRGGWLDQLTGLHDAHLVGEHLRVPGYSPDHPTLEIFSYDVMDSGTSHRINQPGLSHIAFEVDDVDQTLAAIKSAGGGQMGDRVQADYDDGRRAVLVYATDPEGNIVELQSWS